MGSVVQDIRYAFRVLRKSPGFTVVSVLTLALGIVGTTIVFNAYNATVWQPLPVHEPQHLAVLERHYRKGGLSSQFSIADYNRIHDNTRTLSAVAAEGDYDTVLAQLPILHSGKVDEPRQALLKLVSDNYFDVLGVPAAWGRVFGSVDRSSDAPVAVLSYSSWHRRFRNDPAVLGQTVLIYGVAVTIVGITPPDFVGSGNPPVAPDFWIPLSVASIIEPQRRAQSGQEESLRLVARLQPNSTAAQVESELTPLAQQREKERGVEVATSAIVAGPAFYFIRSGDPLFRAMAALLLASFSMVLLVACANMANFFVARSTARRREMAVRTALGARRGHLVRQLLTEGIVLGLAGGTVAVVVGSWLCNFIWVEVQQHIIFRFTDLYVFALNFVPSLPVLAATCVVSILAGALFSLTGALQASRVDLNEVLKGSELAITPGRRLRVNMRDMLIVVQVTLSVVLLVTAALLARGMVRGQSVEPGFNTRNIVDIEFSGLDTAGFDAARVASLRDQLRRRMARIPGVSSVSFAAHVPLLGMGKADVAKSGTKPHEAFDNEVAPGFFATLGIPLVRGRDFTDTEIEHRTPVVIISQATARNLWPGEDSIGKWMLVGPQQRPMQVIGEAQDVRSISLGSIAPYFVYLPLAPDAPLNDVFLRANGDANLAIPQALKAAAEVDGRLASLANAHSMDDALWAQRLPSTLATLLAAFVGTLALVLASIGIYGTIAYAVTQRTREIGIRIALGAPPASIVRLVLSRTMVLVGGSVGFGLALSLLVSRATRAFPFGLESMLLFGVSPRDPLTMLGVAAFLVLVAAVAAYKPAARATRVDPMVALRYE